MYKGLKCERGSSTICMSFELTNKLALAEFQPVVKPRRMCEGYSSHFVCVCMCACECVSECVCLLRQ